jgi:hypothetical protein
MQCGALARIFLSIKANLRQLYAFGGVPMYREPATWSSRDRIAFYRTDAARFCRMAEAESRAVVRDRLVMLARYYRRVANTLENRTALSA